MDRSPSFGSMTQYFIAQLRLAFASAPVLSTLTSHHAITRRPVLQKVRDCTFPEGHSALSAYKHTVSGSISLPSRGSFQLSLTVLFAIGHLVVFSLRRSFSSLHTKFLVFRVTPVTFSFYTIISSTGLLPSLVQLSSCIPLWLLLLYWMTIPRQYYYLRFGLLPVRSPLLG